MRKFAQPFRLPNPFRRRPAPLPVTADERTTPYELLMYSRTMGCPFVSTAKRVLAEQQVRYREIMMDRDRDAQQRVVAWTGFQSVPTLVAAPWDTLEPHTPPTPLAEGLSPRGVARGAMITEPNPTELLAWLRENQFIAS